MLQHTLFDVGVRHFCEAVVVESALCFFFERHVWLDVVHLAWEVNVWRMVVSLEVVELVVLECLVDVLFFNLLAINLKFLGKVQYTDIVF